MTGKIIHLANVAYAREIARSNKIMALAMEIMALPDRERALIDIEIDKIIECNAKKKCRYARNVIQFKTANCNQSRDDDTFISQKYKPLI